MTAIYMPTVSFCAVNNKTLEIKSVNSWRIATHICIACRTHDCNSVIYRYVEQRYVKCGFDWWNFEILFEDFQSQSHERPSQKPRLSGQARANFWLQIQNLCEHPDPDDISPRLVEVKFPPEIWLKHKYGHMRCHGWNFEFLTSDSKISVKIWSRWYIDHHDWWKSNFLQNMAKTQIWPHEIPWVEFGVSDFQIWNLCEIPVQMIYGSSWLVEVKFPLNMAKTQMWSYGTPWVEFWVSDFRFRISVKFWSR